VNHVVVAIDGPAASGKSTVARTLARRLNLIYVNSGAMYRAVTWHLRQKGIDTADAAAVRTAIPLMKFQCGLNGAESTITIDGVDPTPHLCEDEVNQYVSAVSSVPEVRSLLVERQREYARNHDLVMEGRDIGSVVFPNTPYKFYVDASPEVRALRRSRQGQHDEINVRDRFDSSRRTSPLVIAEDAHVIDSSHLTIDGVVGEIVGRLKLKGLPIADCGLRKESGTAETQEVGTSVSR
jgi:cytidylate kinase